MSEHSAIEWTDASWNPVRGCTKVSPGCKHCYAEKFSERFRGVAGHPFENGFDLRLIPKALELPLRWRRSRLIFVNSMSDLFHEEVPDEYILRCFEVMRAAHWHQFQVLTKRSQRLADLSERLDSPANVWVGVSVESAAYAWRIEHLRRVPAAIRFLSVEPLLAPVGKLNLKNIHWVIVGGESGPNARPMDPDWVRDVRRQCEHQGAAFFFKQWGGVRKSRTGRELDGRTWDEMPDTAQLRASDSMRHRLPVLSR